MGFLKSISQAFRRFVGRLLGKTGGGYLCDSCKWDYGDACSRPERPNARTCPDYKRR